MTRKERAEKVCEKLNLTYGTDLQATLDYDPEKPWQLLFATILSAQCTDERVNQVTTKLFVKYPRLEDFAEADLKEFEKDIYSTGFYHNKAKNIIACARKLLKDFDGKVPSRMEDLLTLPGVGRKTANVVRGHIFQEPSLVVDTHVKRVSRLLGLTRETDPVKIEFDLMKVVPKDQWILYNLQVITHGRKVCVAGRPKCETCVLKDLCASYSGKTQKKKVDGVSENGEFRKK